MRAVLVALGAVLMSGISESRAQEIPTLTKENGPFLVSACIIDGPYAEGRARTVAAELRSEHRLTTYVLPFQDQDRARCLVLVGDCKTIAEVKALLKRVRTIRPRSLPEPPRSGYWTRVIRSWVGTRDEGYLTGAMATINPLLDQSQFSCGMGRSPDPGGWWSRFHAPTLTGPGVL